VGAWLRTANLKWNSGVSKNGARTIECIGFETPRSACFCVEITMKLE
jgi:hypothetical protein